MKLKNKNITPSGNAFYFIAEVGHNHMGSLNIAKKLMLSAKVNGADAVKLQKRSNKNLYTKKFYNSSYVNKNSYGSTYGKHREKLEFGFYEYRELMKYAKKIKIDFFSTAFDIESVDFLNKINIPYFKIASADIINTPLIKEIAKSKKPIFLSTGGANLSDVSRAVDVITKYHKKICIMQCTAAYPTDWKDMNLNVIKTYRSIFKDFVIGVSDHEAGIQASQLSYMLGARVFEKHFTLNRANKGTDHAFSLEPEGIRKMVRNLYRVPILLGSRKKNRISSEKEALFKMKKSIVAKRLIKKGSIIKYKDLSFKSPGGGLEPYNYKKIVNKIAQKDFLEDDLILIKNIR
jgi:N-acetylneuraminate synthase/sialic acid synthase